MPTLAPIGTATPTTTPPPSRLPSSNQSNGPSAMPNDVTITLPTPAPVSVPSDLPSNNPSMNPTIPSHEPINVPSNVPNSMSPSIPSTKSSAEPSLLPSEIPTADPFTSTETTTTPLASALPSLNPSEESGGVSSTSTTNLPVKVPTILPTTMPSQLSTVVTNNYNDSNINYDFINSNDISIEMKSISFDNNENIFNPGYQHIFHSNIVITFDTIEKQKQLSNWISNNNNTNNMSINIDWKAYKNDDSNSVIVDSSNTSVDRFDILTFEEQSIREENGVNGTQLMIDSYFVLYNGKQVGKYGSYDSICNTFDQSDFKSGSEYVFENSITIEWYVYDTEYEINLSKSIVMTANSQPENGSCSAIPTTSTALNWVSFMCSGWSDSDGLIYYNFVKQESNTFIESDYIVQGTQLDIETVFSPGNHTVSAIILDKYDLATCVDINVTVNTNGINQYLNTSVTQEFTDWIEDTYENILDDIYDGIDTNISDNTSIEFTQQFQVSQVTNVLETVYEMTQNYVDQFFNHSSLQIQDIVNLQQSLLIDTIFLVKNVNTNISTPSEANTVLSTLAIITTPLSVNTDADNAVYDSNIITELLELIEDDILIVLSNVTSDTAETVLTTISNIQYLRQTSYETSAESQSNGQLVIDIVSTVSQLLLASMIPGQLYTFNIGEFDFTSAKISQYDYQICSDDRSDNDITLSQELLDKRSNNGSNHVDCTIMISPQNVYQSECGAKNDSNYGEHVTDWQSNFVMLEVEPELGSNLVANEQELLNACEPVVISFRSSNDSFWQYGNHFPRCVFYNETLKNYSSNGCYVSSMSSDLDNYNISRIECMCRHTTYFSISWEEFLPRINTVDENFFAEITFENLVQNPAGWLFVLLWVILCILLIIVFDCTRVKYLRDIDDAPLIIQDTAVFHHSVLESEKLKYRSIKEARLIAHDEMKHASYGIKLWHLWRIKMRNDHILWGICCRNKGTSYTNRQRISMLMLRLLTSMAVAALFYAQTSSTFVGEISLSFYESLIGFIPIFVLKQLIVRRRPTSKELEKYSMKKVKIMKSQLETANLTMIDSSLKSVSNPGAEISRNSDTNDIVRTPTILSDGNQTSTHAIEIDATMHLKQRRKARKKELKQLEKLAKLHAKSIKTKSSKDNNELKLNNNSNDQTTQTKDDHEVEVIEHNGIVDQSSAGSDTSVLTKLKSLRKNNSDSNSKPEVLKRVKTKELFNMLQHNDHEMIGTCSPTGTTNDGDNKNDNNDNGYDDNDSNTMVHSYSLKHGMGVTATLAQFAAQTENSQVSTPINGGDIEIVEYDENVIDTLNMTDDIPSNQGAIMANKSTISDTMNAKMQLLDEIRHRLFDKFFKFPSYCRHIGNILIILWTLLCAFVTTIWCMWFDYTIYVSNPFANQINRSQCPDKDKIDIPLQTRLNYNVTQEYVIKTNGTSDRSFKSDLSWDSFGDKDAAQSFVFTVLLSYAFGIILWHPLIVALKSIYTLKKIHDKPSRLRRALLFYDSKNLVNLHEIASNTPSAGATPRSMSFDDVGDINIPKDVNTLEMTETKNSNMNCNENDETDDVIHDDYDVGRMMQDELQLVAFNGDVVIDHDTETEM